MLDWLQEAYISWGCPKFDSGYLIYSLCSYFIEKFLSLCIFILVLLWDKRVYRVVCFCSDRKMNRIKREAEAICFW